MRVSRCTFIDYLDSYYVDHTDGGIIISTLQRGHTHSAGEVLSSRQWARTVYSLEMRGALKSSRK
jgi:hypothetical protein